MNDIFTGGPDSVDAFAAGPYDYRAPGAMYRSQFWFLSGSRDVAYCLGIHGQMIYINRSTGTVGVKLSSWPTPLDDEKTTAAAGMFDAISDHLVGLSA